MPSVSSTSNVIPAAEIPADKAKTITRARNTIINVLAPVDFVLNDISFPPFVLFEINLKI